MAHQLDFSTGKAAIAYTNETPWHGLGQQLSENTNIDTWKVEAGMNWNIDSAQVTFGENGSFPGKTVLYRSDTKAPLSIVSDKYKVVQPEQVLEFFRDLTEDLGMKLSTAGCLYDGKKFWALADTGMAGKVLGNDEIKGNLLLTSSCDGTSPTIATFTSVRTVCNNTLQIALNSSKNKVSVRHQTNFSPEDIKKSLGLMHESWDMFMKSITILSEKEMSDKQARDFYAKIMAKNDEQLAEMPNVLVRNIDELMQLYKNGIGSDMAYGTAWGVINGLSEMTDWRSGGRTADARMWNAWHGNNAKLKNNALDMLLAA